MKAQQYKGQTALENVAIPTATLLTHYSYCEATILVEEAR
jgi:hypothetical protein